MKKVGIEASCVCSLDIFDDEGEKAVNVTNTQMGDIKIAMIDENDVEYSYIIMDYSTARAMQRALGFLLKEVELAGLDDEDDEISTKESRKGRK